MEPCMGALFHTAATSVAGSLQCHIRESFIWLADLGPGGLPGGTRFCMPVGGGASFGGCRFDPAPLPWGLLVLRPANRSDPAADGMGCEEDPVPALRPIAPF